MICGINGGDGRDDDDVQGLARESASCLCVTIISVSVPFTSCEMKHINSQHYKIKEVLSTVLLKQFLVWYDLLHD